MASAFSTLIRSERPARAAAILTFRPKGDGGEERRMSIGGVREGCPRSCPMSRAGATGVSAVRRFAEPLAAVGAIAPPGEPVGQGREDNFGFVLKGPRRIDDEKA